MRTALLILTAGLLFACAAAPPPLERRVTLTVTRDAASAEIIGTTAVTASSEVTEGGARLVIEAIEPESDRTGNLRAVGRYFPAAIGAVGSVISGNPLPVVGGAALTGVQLMAE